jgi:hypothetical protein
MYIVLRKIYIITWKLHFGPHTIRHNLMYTNNYERLTLLFRQFDSDESDIKLLRNVGNYHRLQPTINKASSENPKFGITCFHDASDQSSSQLKKHKVYNHYVGYEALTAVIMKSYIFRDITPFESQLCFGGICRIILRG